MKLIINSLGTGIMTFSIMGLGYYSLGIKGWILGFILMISIIMREAK